MSNVHRQTKKRHIRIINLLLRDGPYCSYCGIKFENLTDITEDHVIPISKNGTNEYENLVLSCHECNNEKADQLGWQRYINIGHTVPAFKVI